MTDATTPVTEHAVERFAEAYLSQLGADIHRDGRRWTVELPETAPTDILVDGATLVGTTDPEEVDDDEIALAPESEFVERLIEEAAVKWPVGTLEFTGDVIDIRHPPWLAESEVEIIEQSFVPYYDRQAICVLYHVGIETVSEYQSETLRAIAIDIDGHDRRPRLAQTYIEVAEAFDSTPPSGRPLDSGSVRGVLTHAREAVEEDIAPMIQETRERATRAAQVELEEYQEYVRQRRSELDSEIDRLTERIEEATKIVENATEHHDRVEALRERKRLRSEREELKTERNGLREEIEAGFPDRREEVRNRHALTVRIRPVALASISYERGDLELVITDGEKSVDTSFAYAAGIGVIDRPQCDRCGRSLTESNPLQVEGTRHVGANCCT